MSIITVHIDFSVNIECHIVLPHELFEFTCTSGFLIGELIAGERSNSQSFTPVFTVETIKLFITDFSDFAERSDINHNHRFATW